MQKQRGYSVVALSQPKNSLNVGSALRAAHCYGADALVTSGIRYKTAPTDTQNAYKHVPYIRTNDLRETVPYSCVPVAIEITDSSESLVDYIHPERAFYVFGPEDGSVSPSVLKWCRDVGRHSDQLLHEPCSHGQRGFV